MSIRKLSPDAVDVFSMVLHPKRRFASSSAGITGSASVFAHGTTREKQLDGASSFVDLTAPQDSLESTLRAARLAVASGSLSIAEPMASYMQRVNALGASARNSATVDVLRFSPPVVYDELSAEKDVVRTRLMPYYRAHRPSNHWAMVNYHAINFFSASSVPSDCAWLYPSVVTPAHPRGCYAPTGSFTIDFHVNPRRAPDRGTESRAGTILHLSSTFALSLVTGSSRGPDGKPDAFRLLLQLSSSADVTPSVVTAGVGTGARAFLSDDNCLDLGAWRHVTVTWGTSANQSGTGSFYVDGVRKGTFVYPSSSVFPLGAVARPDVLCVGNFYEGPNSGSSGTSRFFAADTATREGVSQLDSTADVAYPDRFFFRHQLDAEIHDLSLRDAFVPESRAIDSVVAPTSASVADCLLYVPPFFVPGSPQLKSVDDVGGILITPFATRNGGNLAPFSTDMSFGVGGFYSSLENYTRDFAQKQHARVLHLTATNVQGTTTTAVTANQSLFATASVRMRSANVLPCDDGTFRPNFELLDGLDSLESPRFLDGVGAPELSVISLDHLVSGALHQSLFHQTGSMFDAVVSATPLAPAATPAGELAVYQRTGDPSSNEVVLFDVSSLYYGERIKPGSVRLRSLGFTGSNGKVLVSLRDDGYGSLFRADAATPSAPWNSVGNVFYEEGILVIKAPTLPLFGCDGYELELEGERTTHVTRFDVLVDGAMGTTSSNSTWSPLLSASLDVNREPENQRYVTISGINFHDDDLNVMMRAQLAQPIVKRFGERILIRVSYDW